MRRPLFILAALAGFALLVSRLVDSPEREAPRPRIAGESETSPAAPGGSAPAAASVAATAPEPTATSSTDASGAPDEVAERERRARVLARMLEVLAAIDPNAFPPADEAELARIVQSFLVDELRGEDFEWLVPHFLDSLLADAAEVPIDDDDRRALLGCQFLLGMVFQNLGSEALEQFFPPGIADRLLETVLGRYGDLPPEAQLYLARLMVADEWLRGALPASFIEELLAMDPRPAGLEKIIAAYAEDPVGSAFVGRIAEDHFDFSTGPEKFEVLVPALTEHLRSVDPIVRLQRATTLTERGRTHHDKIAVVSALARVGDAEEFFILANRTQTDPALRKEPILDAGYLHGGLLTLIYDGKVTSDQLLDRIPQDPPDLQQLWITGLAELQDAGALRFLLGLEARAERTRPALVAAVSAHALRLLAGLVAPAAVDGSLAATLGGLRPLISARPAAISWCGAARSIALRTEEDAVRFAVRREVEALAADETRAPAVREEAARCAAELP